MVCSKGIPSTVETRRGNSHGFSKKEAPNANAASRVHKVRDPAELQRVRLS